MPETHLTAKAIARQIIDELPEDTSFDEVLSELAMHRMIERGLNDLDAGRMETHDDIKKRVDAWLK